MCKFGTKIFHLAIAKHEKVLYHKDIEEWGIC